MDIVSKINGNTLSATEFNQIPTELEAGITASGQTPSDAILNQVPIFVSRFAANNFYIDSGVANAYVLTLAASMTNPVSAVAGQGYFVGMTIRFRAGNPNTGASTVNVNSAGVKNLKKEDGTTDLDAGDISATQDSVFRYNGTSFVRVLEKNPLFSNKNAIINGDFNIWQRGTSFASVVDSAYTADRFIYRKTGSMVHDISRSSDVPTFAQAGRLFNYSALVDCQTADTSIGAAEYCRLAQAVEGFNFLPLAQKSMTLSFWVKATKVGIYCVSFRNAANNRSFIAEYTVNASDTWEFKTVVIAASPSAGGWDYTTGIGIAVSFILACGSDFQTTAGAWQAGDFAATANQVNACDSTSNNFQLCGIQLEQGSVATPFENRTIQGELALCQRYFEATYDQVSAGTITGTGRFVASVSDISPITIPFKIPKRVAPSCAVYSDVTGTINKAHTGSVDINATVVETAKNHLVMKQTLNTTVTGVSFHWTAFAEL